MIFLFSGSSEEFESFEAAAKQSDPPRTVSRITWPSQLDTAKPKTLYFVGAWSLHPSKDAVISKCKELGIKTVFVQDDVSKL